MYFSPGLIGSLDLLSVLCHNFDFCFAIFICNFWRSVLAVAFSRVVVLKIVEQEMAHREISNKLLAIYFMTTSWRLSTMLLNTFWILSLSPSSDEDAKENLEEKWPREIMGARSSTHQAKEGQVFSSFPIIFWAGLPYFAKHVSLFPGRMQSCFEHILDTSCFKLILPNQ